jgi:hypothetical protein
MRDLGQPRECGSRVGAERGHRHHAAEFERLGAVDGLREREHLVGPYAPASVVGLGVVQGDLDQAARRAAQGDRGPRQRRRQPRPVDGVDDVGVRDDGARLVGLELPDEVPGEIEITAVGGLGRRLLVAVLGDVGDAQLGEQTYVGGGERLGDGDERELLRRTARGVARLGDPLTYGREVRGQLFDVSPPLAPDDGRRVSRAAAG